MRVGLNSGEVVVRATGNDLHMDYSAVGETTVLAARMEQMATPGSIRLTAGTLGLVEGLVRVNALGPVPVQGLPDPVDVFELVGASPLQRRFQAAAARGLTRFVGRQHELDALHQALTQAESGHGQVVALVGEAGVGKSRLAYEFVHVLIARTEGNPFFLEESMRTLVETGVLVGEPGAYRLAQALPTIQVPATVQVVLAARIDRLPPEEKRLLQTAAVVGTEVPLPLLQAIADLPEVALHRGLAHLQAAEFLYETRLFPEAEYTFKHALTHEVAYGGLLRERRRVLHARVVEALEALALEQVERLGHHALRGEVWDKVVTYCQQAGARAYDRAVFREALASFEQALQALVHLPEDDDTRRLAIDLRLALGGALHSLGEYEQYLCASGTPCGRAGTARGGDQRKSPHGCTARQFPLGRTAQRGLSPGGMRRGGLAARPPGARPGPAAQGTRERGAGTAPARRRPGPRRSSRGRAGRSPLPAGPGPGRRTRHAPAPGALPPRAGPAVPPDRPAGAGPCRPGYRHRPVPRHGHDLLATPGGSHAGADGGATITLQEMQMQVVGGGVVAIAVLPRGGSNVQCRV